MKPSSVARLLVVVLMHLFSVAVAGAASVNTETRLIHGLQSEEILDGRPLPPNDPFKKVREYQLKDRQSQQKQMMFTRGICSPESFAALEGQELTEAIRHGDLLCINDLFSVSGSVGRDLFNQDKMVTVANAAIGFSKSYGGDNSEGLQQLILYLRAGYYVQFYQPDVVGEYGSGLSETVRKALDTFFANPNAFVVSDDNGEVLGEAVTLIDSAVLNAPFIFVVKRLLTSYNQAYEASRSMTIAVNNTMTVLFRGHQVTEFVSAVEKDTSLLNDLYNFYNTKQHLLGTDNEYLLVNVVRELGRFVQYKTLQPKVSGQLKGILAQQADSEAGLPLWLAAAEMAFYYDEKHCDYYSICNFKEVVESDTLPFRHTCSNTLKLRSQNMTVPQADWICEQLAEEEAYFHSKMETNFQPVTNDLNDDLELVIFDSERNYQLYAGLLFGISTDNGGMYLEGYPEEADNQARFIAYEADWMLPEFHVWNLRHEYAHYLDARYNMAGDFNRSVSADTIWWIEGLGEYIARRDENPDAVSEARTKQYSLGEVLRNTYYSGDTLVYRWGYLAVRFMIEQHPSEVTKMLSLMRNDDYETFQYWIDRIGNKLDNEWYGWLETVESIENHLPEYGPRDDSFVPEPDKPVPPDTPVTDHDIANAELTNRLPKIGLSAGKNPYFYVYVPADAKSLSFTIDGSSGTGALEILVRSDQWPTDSEYEFSESIQGDRKTMGISPLKTNTYYYVMAKGEAFSCIELMASYH